MPPPRKKRLRNKGQFKTGYDPRRRVGFTREECRRGYQAAKAKCEELGWDVSAWFFRVIRGHYRKKKREARQSAPPSLHVLCAVHGEEPPY
jgi:hypothetical protein